MSRRCVTLSCHLYQTSCSTRNIVTENVTGAALGHFRVIAQRLGYNNTRSRVSRNRVKLKINIAPRTCEEHCCNSARAVWNSVLMADKGNVQRKRDLLRLSFLHEIVTRGQINDAAWYYVIYDDYESKDYLRVLVVDKSIKNNATGYIWVHRCDI